MLLDGCFQEWEDGWRILGCEYLDVSPYDDDIGHVYHVFVTFTSHVSQVEHL